jgi:hypothetical protein
MSLKAIQFAAALALCLPFPAAAGLAVDVEILDRRSGEVLPVYWHEGERHIAGQPGREYEIRLKNRAGTRVLAVTSVDGVNVITGRSASLLGSGYVLDPRGTVAIDGWRKSMDEVAAFYFTALPDSYAARTGRPDNVGVVGVALFRERALVMRAEDESPASAEVAAPAAAASSDSARAEKRLGTGHGRRLDSGATYTNFERASDEPDKVIRIYYDSRRNLVARGIIPRPHDRLAWRQPNPFPDAFVPDP